MKQWKKGMAVILAFAMVIIGLNIGSKSARAEDAPRFFAEAVTAEPGSEIEIPVKISGNTGIMGLGITFGFDKQVLTPIDDVKQTSLLVGQFNNSIETMTEGAQEFNVKWQGTDNMKEDGELFTLKFKVADNASGSTKVTLTLLEDDTFDEQYENKAVDCEDITITIKDATPEPTQAPKPTEEPDETETPYATKKPYDPTPSPSATEQPSGPTNAPGPGTANVPGAAPAPGGQGSVEQKSKSAQIPPELVTLKSVKTAGKKKLKVTWKSRPFWTTYRIRQNGYQIQYAQNKKFTKKRKTINVSGSSSKKTLSGLASKKTYYVRVRACKYYYGKKRYGSWSNVKKCKVK